MKNIFEGILPPWYKGTYAWAIKKVAELEEPIESGNHPSEGIIRCDPKIALLQNKQGDSVLWFTFWVATSKTAGQMRWGEKGLPLMEENAFLELVKGTIKQGFFSEDFLKQLKQELELSLG